MSMSINGIHANALMNAQPNRGSREVAQDALERLSSVRSTIEEKLATVQENKAAASNDATGAVTGEQFMRGQIASLRMHQAVAQFHQSSSDMKEEIGVKADAFRDRIAGLVDQAHESDNPEAAEKLTALIDTARVHMDGMKETVAERMQMHKDEFAAKLDEMRASIDTKVSTMTERLNARADAAIERATEAGNDQRLEAIQGRLSEALARVDERSATAYSRLDAMEARLGSADTEAAGSQDDSSMEVVAEDMIDIDETA